MNNEPEKEVRKSDCRVSDTAPVPDTAPMPEIAPVSDTTHVPDTGSASRAADRTLTAVFCAVLAGLLLWFILMPDAAVSEDENRELQALPDFSLSSLAEGTYTRQMAVYCADQFPARQMWLRVAATAKLAALSLEVDGVMPGTGGYLLMRQDFPDADNLKVSEKAISAFAAWGEKNGVSCLFAPVGRSQDVLTRYYPAVYAGRGDTVYAQILSGVSPVPTLDLLTPLRSAADRGEYVYYKTDHHWTGEGAFLAYEALGQALGYGSRPREDFTETVAADDFYGTTWSASGIRTDSPDTLTFWRWDGDESVICEIDGNRQTFGMYDLSYLDGKDKYGAFLSGNNGIVTLTLPGEDRETLLLVKDSFAHSLAPLLVRHYNLILVDLRYTNRSVASLCRENGVSRVLFLMNVDTLSGSDALKKLYLGLGES